MRAVMHKRKKKHKVKTIAPENGDLAAGGTRFNHLIVGWRGLEVDGVVLRGRLRLLAASRLSEVVFAVLSGQVSREGDEVNRVSGPFAVLLRLPL